MGIFRQRDGLEGPLLTGAKTRSIGNNLIVGFFLFSLFFLLDVLSWFTEKGGVFSVLSALMSVHSAPPVLDIDENGLLFPAIVIVWLAGAGFCCLCGIRIDLSTRAKSLLPLLVIIGGGFFLSGAFGEALITRYMTTHGYSRCESGDWAQGNGKSRVWFVDYVRQGIECRRRQYSVPEYRPFG
jgi:hypothetical protein